MIKYFVLIVFVLFKFPFLIAQQPEIKSVEVYISDNHLALPVVTVENKLIIEFDVQSDTEPYLTIIFRFCDYGWTPTKNIFLLNQNNNWIRLTEFYRLPVTVKDASYHYKGSFPDKDGFINFPFSGKWRFYITDSQDTSLVYAKGKFFMVDTKMILTSTIKNDELEDKTFWPRELAKVFNITTDFTLPEEFYPGLVDRVEIIQNKNINYPIVVNRNDNSLGRQFRWDANRKFSYIARDISAGNEYRQVDLRDYNFFATKDVNAQRDGLEFSRFFLKAKPDLNGNEILTDYKNPYASYLNVTFSSRPPDDIYGDIYLVGAFNNWCLSSEYKLHSAAGIYSITIPLKRGIYDYQYVVADDVNGEIQNTDWLILEGNTWDNQKVYDIFLYYNEPTLGGYEKIIGYNKLSLK